MSDFTTSPRFFQLLTAPLQPLIPKVTTRFESDRGCHKFTTDQHLDLTLLAHLEKAESSIALIEELNDLSEQGHERNLREMIGFDFYEYNEPVTLNQSSFSRANASRPFEVWRYLFHALWGQAQKHCRATQLEGLDKVLLVDGSLFKCLPRMTWAVYRTTIKKVKGHFFLNLDGLPQKLVLTDGKGNERAVLQSQIKAGYFYVFDRGYDDYTLFGAFRLLRAHFLTRLKSSANFEVLETHLVPEQQARLGVISDQTVRLGGPQSELKLRLIGYQESTGKTYYYLTNRFDLDALSLVELYLYRWQIELFFGWIKHHLQFGHWYSQNPNGVLIQLYAGLITFLLLKLYAVYSTKPEWVALRIDFVRWVQRHLFNRVSQAEIEAYADKLKTEPNLVKT